MTLEEVANIVGETPNMRIESARELRGLIRQHELSEILELGFAHGVGTCYLAAIADEVGGKVTSIDVLKAEERQPNVRELLDRCALSHIVDLYFEPTSYTWRLMKFLESDPNPRFDLCYMDAAHSWFVDGFGFFLVDRLLKPGGWIVFDDLLWTFGGSRTIAQADWVLAMPEEERHIPQVSLVYELLVKPHPNYTEFRVEGSWAYARKGLELNQGLSQVRTEFVVENPIQFAKRALGSVIRRRERP